MSETKLLLPGIVSTSYYKRSTGMEAILKVISFFIALFMVANGIYVIYMPPNGDEPQGLAIIMMGIFIFIAVLWIARLQEKSDNS
jgi:ABC-type Mn2+/Zn2+ transport system permease subunit